MSNRVVPVVYRTIIDSVIESVRPEFDEIGIEEAVLQELLRSWEYKVSTSRVADFSEDAKMGEEAKLHPMLPSASSGRAGVNASTSARPSPAVKEEEDKPVIDGEDEINSDLDDPDEEDLDNEQEGVQEGDIVIALYEKVQRVKNKWKITLKDGLISVGGKEYLFSKCSGEFEW